MGVPLARLAPETSGELRACLGPAAAVQTPVDVAGAADADPGVFARALELLSADPAVGVVLVVGLFGGYGIRFAEALSGVEADAARSMAATMQTAGKGLVVHSQYASHKSSALDAFRDAHVPVIESLEVACRAAAELQRRAAKLAQPNRWRPHRAPGGTPAAGSPLTEVATRRDTRKHPVINAVRRENCVTLTETESRALLTEAGLAFEAMKVVASASEAAEAVGRAGRPVAIKLAGARGGAAVRMGPVVKAAMAVANCVMRWPDVAEVEINPLFVYEERVVPVDGG